MEQDQLKEAVALAMNLGPDNGRRLLEVLAANAAIREFDRTCHVRFAARLLQERWQRASKSDPAAVPTMESKYGIRAEIRDRLMNTYGIKRDAAYRRIDEAIQQLSAFKPGNATSLANNEVFNNAEDD